MSQKEQARSKVEAATTVSLSFKKNVIDIKNVFFKKDFTKGAKETSQYYQEIYSCLTAQEQSHEVTKIISNKSFLFFIYI